MPVRRRPIAASHWLLAAALLGGTALSSPASAQDPAPATTKPAQTTTDEQIVVTAARRNQMQVSQGGQLGALGTKKGLDVPFNIRSYNASLILNQQSQTLGEVLQNDPTISVTSGYGNFADAFVIRGFEVTGDDVSIDGLYGITPRQLVSPQLYESVQVLNGAGAFLNGAAPGGSIGGNINLVFKKATEQPITRVTGDYTSPGIGGGSVDISRRFGPGDQFGARINIAGESGQTEIDHETHHAVAVGGAFDWRSADRTTRITLDMDYQNQGIDFGRTAIFLNGTTSVPRPPANATNYGQPWAFSELNYIFGKLGFEHDFTDHLTSYLDVGGLGGNEKGNYADLTVTNAATGAGTVGNLYVPYIQTNESVRGGLRGDVQTGPVKNEFNAGGSATWEESDTAYAESLSPASSSNLYNPVYTARPDQSYVGGDLAHPTPASNVRLYSLFFSDTASVWHDRIALTAGFRYQDILENSYAYYSTPPLTTGYDQSAITPVVGLVLHLTHHASLYFNRIEGLSEGGSASSTAINSGAVFAPYKSTQYEVGAKYDTGRFAASLAFYRLSQPSVYDIPYGNSGQTITVEDGLQRNQGIELNVNGELIHGLRFNGGATIIDADLKNTAEGAYNGNRAIGVPGYMIKGNVEYDLPFIRGATVVGRVERVGHQWANSANTLRVPGWTRFDLAARYTFLVHSKPLTARFGVDNIANKRYWASAYGGYLLQGDPRTYKLSLTADF